MGKTSRIKKLGRGIRSSDLGKGIKDQKNKEKSEEDKRKCRQ
jgi:hypothetical protein